MKFLVVLCACATVAFSKPYAFTAIAPLTSLNAAGVLPYSMWGAMPMMYHAPVLHAPWVGVKSQYHVQDMIGQASYGHVEPMQSHTAVHDAAGNKVGSFSYVKPDGTVARTDYVADALGYRVASNDLPVAPMKMPMPVAETPEVMAARAAHMAEVAKVKSRARRQAILPASTTPLFHPLVHAPVAYSAVWPHHIPVVTPDGYVADTPEVAAAKMAHFAAHAEAAARG